MSDQAFENANDRIERALSRIEAAVARGAADRALLERRHAALRGQVSAAIASLDSLIATDGDD